MKFLLIALIRMYQKTVSPDHGWFRRPAQAPVCRFTPTCSEYMIEAISAHGIITGVGLGSRRIGHCHPYHKGGYDPVPCVENHSVVTGIALQSRHRDSRYHFLKDSRDNSLPPDNQDSLTQAPGSLSQIESSK